MSDNLRHECGIAVVRLLKPLRDFKRDSKYKKPLWGLDHLHALMLKQRNRGQDGVGIGCCKLGVAAGQPYMFRIRSSKKDSLEDLFGDIMDGYKKAGRRVNKQRETLAEAAKKAGKPKPEWVEFEQDGDAIAEHFDYGGQVLMGHLRYSTSGAFGKASCHPYVRRSNWPTRSLMVLGNFNMANVAELNEAMTNRGQHPVVDTDTQTVLEEIGYQLDKAQIKTYDELRGKLKGADMSAEISRRLDMVQIIRDSVKQWDGGYVITGVVGNGDLFVMRDPHGIRPCYYVKTEDYIAFASERAALRSVFEMSEAETHELPAAHVAVVKADGTFSVTQFTEKLKQTPCSFERIYFSRGNDATIYQGRKALGAALVQQYLDAVGNDLEHTVVSFIPNTAETAFYGFMDELRVRRRAVVRQKLLEMWDSKKLDMEALDSLILRNWPRSEKIAHKDIKSRTFIAQEKDRDNLASSVYDITYDVVQPSDTLVVLDDSIVRGTTLRQSILRILARTNPKRIIIVSTSPQIRYPDCYGIDMSELGKFIAFQAAISLLESGTKEMQAVIDRTAKLCAEELKKPAAEQRNVVKDIYAPFTDEQISARIADLVKPKDSKGWNGTVEVIYQTIPNLHVALGEEAGDWYFSGDFPTPGGTVVTNEAYLRYHQGISGRSYELFPTEA